MNDIVLRGEGVAFGLSQDAAASLLAALADVAPEAIVEAAARADKESQVEADQLKRLADWLAARQASGESNSLEPFERKPSRVVHIEQQPATAEYGYPGLGVARPDEPWHVPMTFSIHLEELDGTFWGRDSMDERDSKALVALSIRMITERRPLSWIIDELKKRRTEL